MKTLKIAFLLLLAVVHIEYMSASSSSSASSAAAAAAGKAAASQLKSIGAEKAEYDGLQKELQAIQQKIQDVEKQMQDLVKQKESLCAKEKDITQQIKATSHYQILHAEELFQEKEEAEREKKAKKIFKKLEDVPRHINPEEAPLQVLFKEWGNTFGNKIVNLYPSDSVLTLFYALYSATGYALNSMRFLGNDADKSHARKLLLDQKINTIEDLKKRINFNFTTRCYYIDLIRQSYSPDEIIEIYETRMGKI